MGGACIMHRKNYKCTIFLPQNLEERDQLVEAGCDGRILKWFLNK
jgi:hypothetical protein